MKNLIDIKDAPILCDNCKHIRKKGNDYYCWCAFKCETVRKSEQKLCEHFIENKVDPFKVNLNQLKLIRQKLGLLIKQYEIKKVWSSTLEKTKKQITRDLKNTNFTTPIDNMPDVDI